MTLMMPRLGHVYPTAVSAIGSVVQDAAGREWIDGSSGAIACSIGHGHPHVLEGIHDQLQKASFLYRTQFASEPALRLAERLCVKLGYDAAFFVNSGSEAVETAVRLAQQFWREAGKPSKTQVLSRTISYHGSTAAALSLSGHWPRRRTAAALTGTPTLPTPNCQRCPLRQKRDECQLACANAVEQEIERRGADNIAALLVEPIVGASAAGLVPPEGYIKRLREICDRHDILLIADEVLTGLGRTGRWLAMDHEGVKADIVILGKGLNAGYFPISGILASERINGLLTRNQASFALGHTHSNHPVAAAAANAVLDILEQDSLVERAATMGAYLGDRLRAMIDDMPFATHLRGKGMLWGVELVQDDISYSPWPSELNAADTVVRHAFDLGLIVYPSSGFINGTSGDAVIVAPPFNTPQAVLDTLVDRLTTALELASRELHRKLKG
ncbi:aminotransferase class III-fold pyridoxal phosphate-dependent enzyme [Roseibium litorale]|uniref:Aminotransferase class III-fold pyridoxal phosphate-dependent enzyme n=1 Tax=Roseibium litorale TaxID=2803841 RepID=A0ABR9CL88_9HYPH|nr:aminotransferase class III-fold pyridoxal phosphate-dependent enzyme [Roseibium litorale]MBD8891314.1 aminotransferase class III-fold pyridoxal phosphate-dependent enzyme [Roseibium litorale]